MENLMNFLNHTSSDRLFGYGIFTLLLIYLIFRGIQGIIYATKGSSQNIIDNDDDD